MPIIFEGDHICQNCEKEFDWVNFELVRTNINYGTFIAEKIPENRVYRVEEIEKNAYRIYVNCPYCGFDNRFIYLKE